MISYTYELKSYMNSGIPRLQMQLATDFDLVQSTFTIVMVPSSLYWELFLHM